MRPFIDLHQDMSSARFFPALSEQTDLEQLGASEAKLTFVTGFTLPEENLTDIVERDLLFYREYCASRNGWKMIMDQEDVDSVTDSELHGLLFHIEGMQGFEGDWDLLADWRDSGLRSVGMVWYPDNLLGGGTASRTGLTDLGREFIAWCEARHVLVDLAHMNPVMFQESIEVATRPPLITHGGLSSVVSTQRNFSDEQLREVVDRGGVVGIFFSKSNLATRESYVLADTALHIKAAIDLLGENSVSIGSDFGGMTSGTPEDMTSVSAIEKLWNELAVVGLTETQIEKVSFMNAHRFLVENL